MSLNDAHCHFFSSGFFRTLARERSGQADDSGAGIAAQLGWDPPGTPDALADRWVAELDRHGVARACLIASVPGDEESVAAAMDRHPDRFVGLFMLNPAAQGAPKRARRAFADLGLRGACLFPAMHRYPLDGDMVRAVFEEAERHAAVVFVHCGYLSIGVRTRLGLSSAYDLRLGDPLALATTASRFPTVPVLVPHFGAGFFAETLMAADMCPSIHLDTSSSNGWMKYVPGLGLAETFRRALGVVGPDRLLFGTDSSFFPRGWQRVIYDAQQAAVDELGADQDVRARIFGGNFTRVFGEPRGTKKAAVPLKENGGS
jgi:predicted TIM-barrel fold metal-dependent hydrolase